MERFDYLIVGGGMTGDAAARGIRSVDGDGSLALLSAEPDPPYDRPPLSKGLWKGTAEERIWRDTTSLECRVLTGRRAVALDRRARLVTDADGREYGYERLLLATGGTPRNLGRDAGGVNYFRTYQDYRALRRALEAGGRTVVVGGGFIGSEIAAALALNEHAVTLLFPEEGVCRRVLPGDLSRHLTDLFRSRGVDVRPGTLVEAVERRGEGYRVLLDSGETVEGEVVVAGLGIQPDTALARESGLETGDGIVTDELFRTADRRIWAAGDVASFPSSVLGRRLRVEHEDHANASGTTAGRGMAGEPEPYDHVPLFYSDLFDQGYEAVGITDPDGMEVVEDWAERHGQGVVYYLEGARLRGVLLWNVRGKARAARALVREEAPVEPGDLRGRIALD